MDPHVDDSPTIDELGIQRTMPFEETLAGMVRWMYQSGHLCKIGGQTGRLKIFSMTIAEFPSKGALFE